MVFLMLVGVIFSFIVFILGIMGMAEAKKDDEMPDDHDEDDNWNK